MTPEKQHAKKTQYWNVCFNGSSQIRRDCTLCLLKCWAFTFTSETSLLSYSPCHQSNRIGPTFIDTTLWIKSYRKSLLQFFQTNIRNTWWNIL